MKKLLSVLLCSLMCITLASCSNGSAENAETESTDPTMEETTEGKVLNIYAWNTEFQDRFNEFYLDKMPEGVSVNWVITPNQDNAYQNKLDETLLSQSSLEADEKIDIFLVEADYALKYVNTDYTEDLGNLGITDADVAGQYQYTKDVVTDGDGALKGVSWQATPAGFIYRRSIMEDVLGSDDPEVVQEALSTWEKFDEVAAMAAEKGYFMLSGFDDDYRVFSNNVENPWVVDDKIVVDPSIQQWVEQTKTYTDMNYNNKANLWSDESFAQAGVDGKVAGYFGPGWFFDFCLMPATLDDPDGEKAVGNGSYGDWGLVKGPQGFFWGGTWLCAATGTDNEELVADVMRTLTCDEDTLIAITNKFGDFTNNEAAMNEIANSDYSSTFLGGQNHISVLADSANSIDMSTTSPYDQGLNESFQSAFMDYYNGNVDEATAYENFYKAAIEKYPNLTK